MTREERQLLEITARNLLKLERDIRDRVIGIEAVQEALFHHHGDTNMALARLRIKADLLKAKGAPSPHLASFLEKASGNKAADFP